ncbi:hypothetical protein [Neobacillus terrae]|uniref:hypothetical protein n=1 Tax=Neobacillus terrae TaxID=3034837 RepID=UPI0030836865
MTLTKSVTNILNAIILSVKAILPFDIKIDSPSLFNQPFTQHSMGVLIVLTGEVPDDLLLMGMSKALGELLRKCSECISRLKCSILLQGSLVI